MTRAETMAGDLRLIAKALQSREGVARSAEHDLRSQATRQVRRVLGLCESLGIRVGQATRNGYTVKLTLEVK